MEKECVFCNIAKKQLPAKIVYEDEFTIGFLETSGVQPLRWISFLKYKKFSALLTRIPNEKKKEKF